MIAWGVAACGEGEPAPADDDGERDAGDSVGDTPGADASADDGDQIAGADVPRRTEETGREESRAGVDPNQKKLIAVDRALRQWSRRNALFTAVTCDCYSRNRFVEYEEYCEQGRGLSGGCVDYEMKLADDLDRCSREILLERADAFASALTCSSEAFGAMSECLSGCPTTESEYDACFGAETVDEACVDHSEMLDVIGEVFEAADECSDQSPFVMRCSDGPRP